MFYNGFNQYYYLEKPSLNILKKKLIHSNRCTKTIDLFINSVLQGIEQRTLKLTDIRESVCFTQIFRYFFIFCRF